MISDVRTERHRDVIAGRQDGARKIAEGRLADDIVLGESDDGLYD